MKRGAAEVCAGYFLPHFYHSKSKTFILLFSFHKNKLHDFLVNFLCLIFFGSLLTTIDDFVG